MNVYKGLFIKHRNIGIVVVDLVVIIQKFIGFYVRTPPLSRLERLLCGPHAHKPQPYGTLVWLGRSASTRAQEFDGLA